MIRFKRITCGVAHINTVGIVLWTSLKRDKTIANSSWGGSTHVTRQR